MAYQTLGNRVLGGIGAPGGGMAESFNAGVNTSLSQRTVRQNMAAQAQDMATAAQELKWKEEDRKIAAQQRAAAAAARSRAQALAAQQAKIFGAGGSTGTTAVGLTLPATPGMARDRQGANVNPRYYPTAGGAPTATTVAAPEAGGVTAQRPKLSFNLGVPAGAPPTPTVPTAGTKLGVQTAPVVTAQTPTPVVPTTPAALPVVTLPGSESTLQLSPDGTGILTDTQGAVIRLDKSNTDMLLKMVGTTAEAVRTGTAPPPLPVAPVNPNAPINRADVRNLPPAQVGPIGNFFGGVGDMLSGQTTEQMAINEAARLAAGRPVDTTANAPPAVLPPAVDPQTGLTFATGVTPSLTPFGQTPLSFGPSLGAQPQTQEDMMISQFATQTTVTPAPAAVAGQAAAPAAPVQPLPDMGKSGQPNYAINILLSERDKQVQWIQALLDAGKPTDAMAAQIELAAIDSKLQGAAGRLAIEEMVDYNSTQRINEIWTQMKQGRNYEFVPLNDGNVAVYVDGKLQIDSTSMDKIIEATLSMTNQTYVEQQGALAAVYAEAEAKARGESQGKLPAALEIAAVGADLDVTKANLLSEIAVAQATGINLAETMQKYVEYDMQQRGLLPAEAKKYEYRDMGDGNVGVFDGGKLLTYLYVDEVAGPPNADGTPTTIPVVREQPVGQ